MVTVMQPARASGEDSTKSMGSTSERTVGLWTVPNAISLVRLGCIPWFVYLAFGADDLSGAAYLLAVLGATDWIDGWIARRYRQVSTFGKVIDPTVDRIMLAVAAVSILVLEAMPLWFGLVALLREVLIGVAGIVLYFAGARRIDVQFVGKAGAFGLMVALPLFLVSASGVAWRDEARLAAWLFGIPAVVFSWYSVLGYVTLAKQALRTGEKGAGLDSVS